MENNSQVTNPQEPKGLNFVEQLVLEDLQARKTADASTPASRPSPTAISI